MNDTTLINIILADDDQDDCLIFKEALEELSLAASLTVVHDGEQLLQHLKSLSANLPQAIFLDLNMPRKNGYECLTEIKNHPTLKILPVIVYSTSYDQEKANLLHKTGAHYYICKPADFDELKDVLHQAITLLGQNNLQATRETFYINKPKRVL